MGWWPFGSNAKEVSEAPIDNEVVVPDLTDFERLHFGHLSSPQLISLISVVQGEIDHATPPQLIPLHVIEAMGWDPVIYAGEQAVMAPVLDPDLYRIKHPDPVVRATTDAWLRPLLPELLPMLARAFAWGCIPYVLDWNREDLGISVKTTGGDRTDSTVTGHVHYKRAHEIWPADANLLIQNDDLLGLRVQRKIYGRGRGFLAVWDRQFGSFFGMGSRRRAYRAWFTSMMVELWHARWLERSVDPPRIGFAPKGMVKINGREVASTELMTSALMALKNGGATSLPSELGPEGKQRLWDVKILELPDRSEVWDKALNRYDAQKLIATLVPPTSTGLADAKFAAARIPAELFVQFVQRLASFVASELTKIVSCVHRVNRGMERPEPMVIASEIPQAKRKVLLDVFKMVAGAERRVGEGQVVTLAELVGEDLLDMLNLPRRPLSEAARNPTADTASFAGPPGRPSEATGDRERRREVAREPEGRVSVGKPGNGVDPAGAGI